MLTGSFLAAVAQMTSSSDRSANLSSAVRLVNQAADRGARLVGLPENFAFMGSEEERLATAETLEGPTLAALRELARARRVYVLAGSVAERLDEPGKTANTSVLLADDGSLAAVYRKIHLFDVAIPDGARYAESESVRAGAEVVVVQTPLGCVGLSVCYDVRFPELYRRLSEEGAEILTVPAAFTLHTGKDHWEVLLRARAIEAQAYVLAPAQGGRHAHGRVTHGHAMIVDPWGVVLAQLPGEGEGVCLAELSPGRLAQVRRELPALAHRRLR